MNTMIESMLENMVELLEDLNSGPYSDYETWRNELKVAGIAFNALCDLRTAMYHNRLASGRYAVCGDGTFHNLTDMDEDEVESFCDGDWKIFQEGMTVGQVAREAIAHGCEEQSVWSQIIENDDGLPKSNPSNLMVRIYKQGYHAGHKDTVEACFIPIHHSDMKTYKLTSDVLVLMIDGNRVDSFHRLGGGDDWSIESFTLWAKDYLASEGY